MGCLTSAEKRGISEKSGTELLKALTDRRLEIGNNISWEINRSRLNKRDSWCDQQKQLQKQKWINPTPIISYLANLFLGKIKRKRSTAVNIQYVISRKFCSVIHLPKYSKVENFRPILNCKCSSWNYLSWAKKLGFCSTPWLL